MAPDKRALAEAGRRKLEEFRKAKGQAGKSTPPPSPEPAPKETTAATAATPVATPLSAAPTSTGSYASNIATANQPLATQPATGIHTATGYQATTLSAAYDSSSPVVKSHGYDHSQQNGHDAARYSPPQSTFVVASGAIPFQSFAPQSAGQTQGYTTTWPAAAPAPAPGTSSNYTNTNSGYGTSQSSGSTQAASTGPVSPPAVGSASHAGISSAAQPSTTWSYVSSARALFGSPDASVGGAGADFFSSNGVNGTAVAAPLPLFPDESGTAGGEQAAAATSSTWSMTAASNVTPPASSWEVAGGSHTTEPAAISHAFHPGGEDVADGTAGAPQAVPWQPSISAYDSALQQPLAVPNDFGLSASPPQPYSSTTWQSTADAPWQKPSNQATDVDTSTSAAGQVSQVTATDTGLLSKPAEPDASQPSGDATSGPSTAAADDGAHAPRGMTNSSSMSQWLGLEGSHSHAPDTSTQQQPSSAFLFDGSHSLHAEPPTSGAAANTIQPELQQASEYPSAVNDHWHVPPSVAEQSAAKEVAPATSDLPPPPPTASWWSSHRPAISHHTPSSEATNPSQSAAAAATDLNSQPSQPAAAPAAATNLYSGPSTWHDVPQTSAGKSWWSWGTQTGGDTSVAASTNTHDLTARAAVDAAGTSPQDKNLATADFGSTQAATLPVAGQPFKTQTVEDALDTPLYGVTMDNPTWKAQGTSLQASEQAVSSTNSSMHAAAAAAYPAPVLQQPTGDSHSTAPAQGADALPQQQPGNAYAALSDLYLGGSGTSVQQFNKVDQSSEAVLPAVAHQQQEELSSCAIAEPQQQPYPGYVPAAMSSEHARLDLSTHQYDDHGSRFPIQPSEHVHNDVSSTYPAFGNTSIEGLYSTPAPDAADAIPSPTAVPSPTAAPQTSGRAPTSHHTADDAPTSHQPSVEVPTSQTQEPAGLSLADAFASFVKDDDEEKHKQAQQEEQPKRGRFGWLFGTPKSAPHPSHKSSPPSEPAAQPDQVSDSHQAETTASYDEGYAKTGAETLAATSNTFLPPSALPTEHTGSQLYEVRGQAATEVSIGGWGQSSTISSISPTLPSSKAVDAHAEVQQAVNFSNGASLAMGQQQEQHAYSWMQSSSTAAAPVAPTYPSATAATHASSSEPSKMLQPASQDQATSNASAPWGRADETLSSAAPKILGDVTLTSADSQPRTAVEAAYRPEKSSIAQLPQQPSSSAFRAGLSEQAANSTSSHVGSTYTTVAMPALSPWPGANSTSAAFNSSSAAPGTSPKTTLAAPYSISGYTIPAELQPGSSQTASFLESYLDKLLVDMPRKEPEPVGENEDGDGNADQAEVDGDHGSQGAGSHSAHDNQQRQHAGQGSGAASVSGQEEGEGGREVRDRAWPGEGSGRPPPHPGGAAQQDGPFNYSRASNGNAPGMPRVPSSGSQFSLLQQHIEELTEEKMELTRGLAKQAQLHAAMQEENATLIQRLNAQGKQLDALNAKLERYELELNAQVLAVEGMAAEREAARVAHDEAAARANALAGEVVNLESAFLAAKNNGFKLQRDLDARSDQVSKLEKQLTSMRKDFSSANEDVGRLTQEKRALFVRLKQTESRLNKLLDETGASMKAREALLSGLSPVKAESLDQGAQCDLLDNSQVEQLKAELEQAVVAANVAAQEAATAREAAREADDRTRAASAELTATLHQLKQLQEQQAAAAVSSPTQLATPMTGQLQLATATSQALARFGQAPSSPYSPVMNRDAPSAIIADKVLAGMPPAMQAALMAARDMPALLGPIAQLARWLPQGPVSAGSPEAAVIEEQVRLVASIHSMLDQYESEHRETVQQLQALQMEAVDLRAINKDLRYKLELATQRLELSLSQGAGMAAMMQAAGMTSPMIQAKPGDASGPSPPMHVTYTQHMQELAAAGEGPRSLQAELQPLSPVPFMLEDGEVGRDMGMQTLQGMPQGSPGVSTEGALNGVAANGVGLDVQQQHAGQRQQHGQNMHWQQQQPVQHMQQPHVHSQLQHMYSPGVPNGPAAKLFQDDLQEMPQQGKQRSGWMGLLFGRQPRPTKRIRNALL